MYNTREKRNAYLKEWRRRNPEKRHEQHIKAFYGLSSEDYKNMWTEQEGKCKICGVSKSLNGKGKDRLCIDHSHVTGKTRGLLCIGCNTALGNFKENVSLLKKAIDYIAKNSSISELLIV